MLHPFVLHNGEIRSASEPVFSAGQVGLLTGWGVFSTLRISNGVLFAFERHWARMKRDADLLRIPMPWSAEETRRQLLRLVEENQCPDATLRVSIFRNTGTIFAGPHTGRESDLIAGTAGLTAWSESVRLCVMPDARFAASPYSRTKVLSWAFNLNWYHQARERGFDEVVLLNERKEVAECTSANIFAVFGDNVYTPPLDSGCLPGITREILLDSVHAGGIRISERKLTLAGLEDADRIFITSSTRDLLPVAEIEGLKLRNSGGLCERLRLVFRQYIEDYVESKVIA